MTVSSSSSRSHFPLARKQQARSQDFVQEGPAWRGPKVPPIKNRKLLGFGPQFLGPDQFIFYFLIFAIKFCFIFPLKGEAWPRAPPPPGYISGEQECPFIANRMGISSAVLTSAWRCQLEVPISGNEPMFEMKRKIPVHSPHKHRLERSIPPLPLTGLMQEISYVHWT